MTRCHPGRSSDFAEAPASTTTSINWKSFRVASASSFTRCAAMLRPESACCSVETLTCFPPGTGRKRRRDRIADAHAALERLVKDGAGVEVDGRLLPPVPRDRNRAPPPPERTA